MKSVKYEINTLLVKDMTIGEVMNIGNRILKNKGSKNTGIDQKLGIASLFVRNDLVRYTFNSIGYAVKVDDFYRFRQTVSDDFIHIHRLNYLTFNVVQDFADGLDGKGLLTCNLKKSWGDIEKMFVKYQKAHSQNIEHSAWMTVQDHLRLVCDIVTPYIEPLCNAVRDYLIQHRSEITACGQKDDISLLTRIYVILLFCSALRNTRINFFGNIFIQKGVDLSVDYKYADIDCIGRMFVYMAGFLGVRFAKDKDGDYVPAGVDVTKSTRVETAWDAIVRLVTDRELMDNKALEAINMNPETKKDYEKRIEAINEQEMKDSIGELGSRFKVGKL